MESQRNSIGILKQIIQIVHPYLLKQTKYCKHKNGCVTNVLGGASKSFAIAYFFKALFGIVSLLMNKKEKKTIIGFIKILIESDTIRFALFPGIYTLIQKGVICTCRHLDHDNKSISFIAGFLAGSISLSILQENKRSNWALYLFTRSMDTIFISLQNKNYIPKNSYYYIIFMALEVLITAYSYGNESDALEGYMLKFYTRFGNEGRRELDLRECWHEMQRLKK